MTLVELLQHLQERGSSVTLNWGEDTDLWECSFISGGVRYTAHSLHPEQAVRDAWKKAVASVPAYRDHS